MRGVKHNIFESHCEAMNYEGSVHSRGDTLKLRFSYNPGRSNTFLESSGKEMVENVCIKRVQTKSVSTVNNDATEQTKQEAHYEKDLFFDH